MSTVFGTLIVLVHCLIPPGVPYWMSSDFLQNVLTVLREHLNRGIKNKYGKYTNIFEQVYNRKYRVNTVLLLHLKRKADPNPFT